MQEQTPDMVTLACKVAYDGLPFSGFARQKDDCVETVQEHLEKALSTVFRRPVETVCAGRTDAGVHALGQVISFEVPAEDAERTDGYKLCKSLNALTPESITVNTVWRACDGFSARFDAQWREYRYRIVSGPVPPLFLRQFAWWTKVPLDEELMREAAACLVGEHDFKSFCKAASSVDKTTMRCVNSIDIYHEEHLGEDCLVVKVVGNAFLHSMVRTIVGTLAEVGAGRRKPEWVADALAACDRNAAGPTAPACGLTFWQVAYDDGCLTEI